MTLALEIPDDRDLGEEEFVEQFVIVNSLAPGSKLYTKYYNETYIVKYIQDKWIWLEDDEGSRFRIGSSDIKRLNLFLIKED